MSTVELFSHVDDFCRSWPATACSCIWGTPTWVQALPSCELCETITITIHFHQSRYRDFKAYYTEHILKQLRAEFPGLVSYNRFVESMPPTLLPLCLYLVSRFARPHDLAFIASTPLPVCHNKRMLGMKSLLIGGARQKFSLWQCHQFSLFRF